MSGAPLSWQEFGLAGVIALTLVSTFIWWVREARRDLRESHHQFVQHLQSTGERQTEAMVASTVAQRQTAEALREVVSMVNRHDIQASTRWEAAEEARRTEHYRVLDAIDAIRIEAHDHGADREPER